MNKTLAKYINSLEYKELFDENGKLFYTESTWKIAVGCLNSILNANDWFFTSKKLETLPELLPFSGSSIDIYWKDPKFELLINIPESSSVPISGYYEDSNGYSVEFP